MPHRTRAGLILLSAAAILAACAPAVPATTPAGASSALATSAPTPVPTARPTAVPAGSPATSGPSGAATAPPPTPVPAAIDEAAASAAVAASIASCTKGATEVGIEETPPAPASMQAPIVIESAEGGAALVAGPIPDDPSTVLVAICAWRPAGGTSPAINGGTVGFTGETGAMVDRALRTQRPPVDNVIGGRATADVQSVIVELADGSPVDAVVRGGYWLAWWTGDTGSSTVTAIDATGATISSVPFDVAAP